MVLVYNTVKFLFGTRTDLLSSVYTFPITRTDLLLPSVCTFPITNYLRKDIAENNIIKLTFLTKIYVCDQ